MKESVSLYPIGVFLSAALKKYEMPRQPLDKGTVGTVILNAGYNFEQALEGLSNFDRIWLLFTFHEAKGWRPKVLPIRAKNKVGLFATRSPHRPHPIGLSCVQLLHIDKRSLYVQGADLLDKTPILDIKPYIPYCDSFPSSKAGWVDEIAGREHKLLWSDRAYEQRRFLQEQGVVFFDEAFTSLKFFSGANHYNRISHLYADIYMLGYKAWRFVFSVDPATQMIRVLSIESGYRPQELLSPTAAVDSDILLHRHFAAVVFASKEYV